jgi:hypothetical protein
MPLARLATISCLAALALSGETAATFAAPVTGWLVDPLLTAAALSAANTNAPSLGSGASNNADNAAMYALLPLVSLADGQQIVLTGSAQMVGTASVPDFRWGLFKDDGAAPATAGWLGYIASAESNVWSKDPTGTSFTTATFASVASGRGALLGTATEPGGHPFDPGAYAFNMTVQRFGNEAAVKVAITNSATGFAIETPFYSETNPARRTFAFDRVGFLAGSALDADQIRFSGIDVTAGDIQGPTLKVFSSGLVFITNPSSQSFDLTHYEIASAGGGLDPAGWLSLDDQENNDPVGTGWEEAGGSTANILGEVNLLSATSLNNGSSLRFGSAFKPSFPKDLTFRFTAGEQILRGPVKYLLTGDYNGNGTVDAADYVVWRHTFGQTVAYGSGADGDGDGVISLGDFAAWRNSFNATLAPTAGQATAAPEPSTIRLIGLAYCAMCSVVARHCVRRQ